jgi:hypothetical protein
LAVVDVVGATRARVPALIVTALALLAAASPRVAIMPARGGDDVEPAIRAAIGERVNVVDAAALARLIASAAEAGLSCDPSLADCATRIGAFGGLDFVVITQLEAHRATLALYDCSDGRQVRSERSLLSDDARAAGLQALAHAVVGDGDARGEIIVGAPSDGVVIVDGVEHGAAPLTLAVSIGKHMVSWRSHGEVTQQSVDVPAAAAAHATFAASASVDKPLEGVAIGVTAIGGVVAVAGGVGAFIAAPGDRAQYSARDYNDAVALGRVLLGVGVGAALVAVAAGGVLALSDGAP